MQKAHRSHDEATAEMLRGDLALAAAYLNDVLESGDDVDVMLALRSLSGAFAAERGMLPPVGTRPEVLRQTLSAQASPSLETLRSILNSMGLRLAVQPIE